MAFVQQIWELKGLRKQNTSNLSDVIIGTQWKVTLVDGDGYSGSFDGATPFKPSDVNPNNFTTYSDLTESQVLTWVKNVVSGSGPGNYWSHITEQVQKKIDSSKWEEIRVESNDFPWASGSANVYVAPDNLP